MEATTEPTNDEIRSKVKALVTTVDLETTGLKAFVKDLEREFGSPLKHRKDFIKECLTDALNEGSSEEESDGDESEGSPSTNKKGRGGGGLAEKKKISAELAHFFGRGDMMSRTEIVKGLWEHIREHNLQNAENKREIILDSALKNVFGCESFTMFSMNKYIGAHVDPFKPVDLTPSVRSSRKRKPARSKSSTSSAKKRKPMVQPEYRLSDTLADLVGSSQLSRPKVVSKLWEYIKGNELQNPTDKREILCDDKLKAVMKRDKVTMFNMNKLISHHFIERVETKSAQLEPIKEESTI